MNELIAYNQRQYKLMLARLRLYKEKKITLRKLIASINGLLYFIKEDNEEWSNNIRIESNQLEDLLYDCFIYPKCEDLKEKDKTDGTEKEINEGIENLIKLIEPKMIKDDYLDFDLEY